MNSLIHVHENMSVYSGSKRLAIELLKQGEKLKDAAEVVKKTKTQHSGDFEKANFLCCRECKYPITQEANRININERHQHVFANPHGYVFNIGCFSQAPGCINYGEATSFFSWFPGYSWQIVLCRQCTTLLGWFFQSNDAIFWGLILDRLINFLQIKDE